MKKILIAMSALGLFVLSAHAIGTQSGWFRSQATQGKFWQGTATIVEEQFNITVYADYLDVELDWVIETGGTEPDSFQNALEIVGTLNLAGNSSVVGLLTWYKDMVLKGKLKTKEEAREQYEEVVQRDVEIPPRPRDPVLLERLWNDRYRISIFPVTFGQTRHVRIRYLIPAYLVDGVNKITYPNAFSRDARVFIKKGDGIKGFHIGTSTSNTLFDNRNFTALSSAEYSFQSYSSGDKEMIIYITPVLPGKDEGSRFYVGDFSAPLISGQMAHVTTMSSKAVLQHTGLTEDFVILWRWNHPHILAKYARQIVAQSTLLQEFLESLDAANKRAALVIDKEGGERIIFRLDSPGSAEYERMMAYLDGLSMLSVVNPPMRSTPAANLNFDINKAFEEFREALRAAVEQFDQASSALKHLLILCVGPRRVSGYVADQTVDWDSDINVSLLSAYFRSSGKSRADLGSTSYWPGVNIGQFLNKNKSDLRISATVGNGKETHSIEVLAAQQVNYSCREIGTAQMHLYSSRPLRNEIKWTVYRGDQVLSEFVEKPHIVAMSEGMQYARLIGASPHLIPLAQQMPSSMAASLGFVDEEYALVALEEDALPALVAALFEAGGVPLLDEGDIFPADDERADMPVDEWLAANPPVPMTEYMCDLVPYFPYWGFTVNRQSVMVFDWGVSMDAQVSDFMIIAVPMAGDTIALAYSDAYVDWDAEIAVEQAALPAPKAENIRCFFTGRHLVVDLAAFSSMARERIHLTLYDISGRMVQRWSGSRGDNSHLVRWDVSNAVPGLYVVSIRFGKVRVSRKVMVVR